MYGQRKRQSSIPPQWRRPLTYGQLSGVRGSAEFPAGFNPTSSDIPADWRLTTQWVDPPNRDHGEPILTQKWELPDGGSVQLSYSRPLSWGPAGPGWTAFTASKDGGNASGSSGGSTGSGPRFTEGLNPHQISDTPTDGVQEISETDWKVTRGRAATGVLEIALFTSAGVLASAIVSGIVSASADTVLNIANQVFLMRGANPVEAHMRAAVVAHFFRTAGLFAGAMVGTAVAFRGVENGLAQTADAARVLNKTVSVVTAKEIARRLEARGVRNGRQGGARFGRFQRPYKSYRRYRR